jgi:hypothetical protein
MGLNLPVKTIVFTTLTKWDGEKEITLSDSSIRQIAGRAGRYGMHEVGTVTALNRRDLAHIRAAMAAEAEPLPTIAPIAPHMKMLDYLAQETGRNDLPSLLDCFAALPGDTDLFSKADVSSMRDLASQIGDFRLPLATQFALCACPVDTRSGDHMRAWRQWAAPARAEVHRRRRHRLRRAAPGRGRSRAPARRVSLDAPPDARPFPRHRGSAGRLRGHESVHLELPPAEERPPLPPVWQRTARPAPARDLRPVLPHALRAQRLTWTVPSARPGRSSFSTNTWRSPIRRASPRASGNYASGSV